MQLTIAFLSLMALASAAAIPQPAANAQPMDMKPRYGILASTDSGGQ